MTSPAATPSPDSLPLPGEPAPISPKPATTPIPLPRLAQKSPFPSTGILWLGLLALTIVGGYLRFWRLGYQAYWQDEAYTINRIRGSYAYMLEQLSDQGFPPGWYSILRFWRIFLERFMPPGDTYQPVCLRAVPALFGTLTVPAMYFLARQFTDRRGALLVMLLAAVNPFLIYYSRDIKMYAGFWFFVVLNMALFFHWQTTRRHAVWFPLFLLSGVVMTTLHSMAWALVALQLIFLLTRPRPKAWDAPLWLLAAGVMAVIPVYWYLEYLQPARWSGRLTNDVDKGMDWITMYTDMSWRTLAGLPTSHVLGYLWPVYPPTERINDWFLLGGEDFSAHLAQRSWPWMAQAQFYAAVGLFAIMLAGLIPWRGIRRSAERDASCTRGRWWWVLLWIALPSAALALTWLPTTASLQQELTERRMELRHTTQDRDQARRQLAALPEGAAGRPGAAAELAAQESAVQQREREIAALQAQVQADWFHRVWHGLNPKPLWEPRYLGIIVPAWLLWLGVALRRLPTLPVRVGTLALVAGACTYSALSNHLMYRNVPFHREAAILEQFIDPQDRTTTAVAVPEVKYPDPAEYLASAVARRIVPWNTRDVVNVPYSSFGRSVRESWMWPPGMADADDVLDWLKNDVAGNPRLKTLVLTDRYGDLADPNPLSDEALGKLLGPRWQLVYRETYQWHYEWRFYIFHTWRTRVWKLTP